MSAELLRVYQPWECVREGYPYPWSNRSALMRDGSVLFSVTEPALLPQDQLVEVRPAIKHLIREQVGHRCLRCGHPYPPGISETCPRGEWTPCDEHCTHDLRAVRVVNPFAQAEGALPSHEAHWRILTVHHLNEDKADCRWWNLAALCQRCHLRMQRAVVVGRPYHFEHSGWFKPYAAGWYAFRYEGVELTREETMARLDDLLSWELRFRQETML